MLLSTKHLSGDMFGGITAAIVALPLALAFGVQSGMGAIAGLYGAIAVGFFAALFGGTQTQISGPTGPLAVVASVIIAGEIAFYGSLDAAIGTIVATFVLAGVFQILLGIFKIGQYIRYIPYPVVSGFMSGIGSIIIIMQIYPFFGLVSPPSIVEIISSLGNISGHINIQALLLAVGTIAIIYLFPRLTKKVPSTLIALISLTILSTFMGLNVSIIGDIPNGFPEVHIDTLLSLDWHHPMLIVIPAITLAALGSIDSLLTSVVADNMTKTQHDSNKELLGQGIGNIVAGLIGGLPGAGATMRTVVNINAGGKTNLSGVIHGVVLVVILFGAGAYAKLIPLPVLAGILITVGIGIIDYKGIKHLKEVPRADAVIMIIVLLLTVFVDLLQAVGIGMVLASILFMKQMGDMAENKSVSKTLKDFHDVFPPSSQERESYKAIEEQVYIQHFNGPIFFGFTAHFKQMMKELPEVSVVIFRMYNVPSIDQSGMYVLDDAIYELNSKNITVLITGLNEQPKRMLENIKVIPTLVPKNHLFVDLNAALEMLKEHQSNFQTTKDKKNIHEILWND
ncbi:SulP family inorganic anion transporter [Sulfurimonas sp. SAG-AH-194-C20]|nr:SulP family inorganic anion transporter [Sulfurimonas sp. SAG-AH-194-C20]MDF1878065.1 SulP family inorganic anion transporter [Sulfurimonas sp. SAG-AH-194-C20]